MSCFMGLVRKGEQDLPWDDYVFAVVVVTMTGITMLAMTLMVLGGLR